ncbi:MAG: hypothetical protein OEV42_01035 [Deltaproteobacteria bacterium]|nr:hypothetical protein [Deltaproteobacteria bacterium]
MICCIFLTACDRELLLIQAAPENEKRLVKRYIELLGSNQYDEMFQYMDDELKGQDLKANIKLLSEEFPRGNILEVKLVGRQVFKNNYYELVSLKHEYTFRGKWLITNIGLKKKEGKILLTGIHAELFNDSLLSRNAFKFDNAGPVHYLFLAMAILIPLFILIVIVLCLRTPIAEKKWLWLFFVSTGFGQFTLNWTTGTFIVTPLSLIILGASAVSPGYMEPLKLFFAIPVGAVTFLILRKKLSQNADQLLTEEDFKRDEMNWCRC